MAELAIRKQERRGTCLAGVSDICVCYLKGAPTHQFHRTLHCHSGSVPCQIPALPSYKAMPVLQLDPTACLPQMFSLTHSPAVPCAWEPVSLLPGLTLLCLLLQQSFWQKLKGRSLVRTILWFLLLTLLSLEALQILQTKPAQNCLTVP